MTTREIPGVRIGHWSDDVARTGCTVVLFPEGTVGGAEVRGGAPATREGALLDPNRTVTRIDAAVLTGGSAFGLACVDGVLRFCEERGIGFVTAAGPVPIVSAFGLYDLVEGDSRRRPVAADGYVACEGATHSFADVPTGRVGAGTGATINKWNGREHARPGGLGAAVVEHGDLVVGAIVAVNAWGDILEPGDTVPRVPPAHVETAAASFENTTIGVVVTNAILDKRDCLLLAQSGHDGMARALSPVHSTADGDALITAATGQVEAPIEAVRALAAPAVELAIRGSVRTGEN